VPKGEEEHKEEAGMACESKAYGEEALATFSLP
jgi:hypothetical protein